MALQADHFVIEDCTTVFNVAFCDEEVEIFDLCVGEGLKYICESTDFRIAY